MWYTLYDSQAKVFRAIGEQWKGAGALWSNAYAQLAFPITARRAEAIAEALHRMFKEYPKPEFGIESIFLDEDTAVGVEQTTVLDLPFARLLRFRKMGDAPKTGHMSDCLIVAPLSGHYATLLRDTVKGMLVHCDTVYITDWKNVRDVPVSEGLFHLSTYVHTIEHFMDHIGKRVHVMAVCQPVVPVLMSASRRHAHPNRPLSMTLIGGPIDARLSPTSVNDYATEHDLNWFKQRVIDYVPLGYAGAGRRVYPGFLQHFGFVAMNPQRHAKAYQDFFEDLLQGDKSSAQKHRAFYDEYNAVLDLDAAYYIDTIEEVFQKFSLAKGEMTMEGQLIVPSRIHDIALLTIEGEKDDIAGIGQTRAAQDLCSGLPARMKRHWEVPDVGHYGVFSGSTFRRTIAPEIAKWQASMVSTRTLADLVRELPTPSRKLNVDTVHLGAGVLPLPGQDAPRPANPEPASASLWTSGPGASLGKVLDSIDEQAAQAVLHGAHWLPAKDVKNAARWTEQGALFGIERAGQFLYPKYALDASGKPLVVIKRILAVFSGKSSLNVAAWFEGANSFLGGKRPRELLESAPGRVLAAAKDEQTGVLHG